MTRREFGSISADAESNLAYANVVELRALLRARCHNYLPLLDDNPELLAVLADVSCILQAAPRDRRTV